MKFSAYCIKKFEKKSLVCAEILNGPNSGGNGKDLLLVIIIIIIIRTCIIIIIIILFLFYNHYHYNPQYSIYGYCYYLV